MWVRMIRGQVRPGQVDEFVRRWKEQAAPRIQGSPGLRNLYMSGDRGSGTIVTVALLEQEPDEAARAAFRQTFERFREQVQDLVAGPPTIEEFEVLAQI